MKVVALASRKEMTLDLRRPDSFDVACSRQIEVSPGDKILIRANDKRLSLTNGQVLTISGAARDGALQTNEGLCVPTELIDARKPLVSVSTECLKTAFQKNRAQPRWGSRPHT
jgi:hypothetical protein